MEIVKEKRRGLQGGARWAVWRRSWRHESKKKITKWLQRLMMKNEKRNLSSVDHFI